MHNKNARHMVWKLADSPGRSLVENRVEKKTWLKNIAWNEFNEYSFVNRLRFRATLESNTFERQTRFVRPNFSNLYTYKDILVTFNKCILIILLCIYGTSNM